MNDDILDEEYTAAIDDYWEHESRSGNLRRIFTAGYNAGYAAGRHDAS